MSCDLTVKMNKKRVHSLIQHVKEKSILYESNLKSRSKSFIDSKEEIWQEIAEKLNMDVYALKVKWKNLRDCYKRYIRAITDEEGNPKVISYRSWPWAKHLHFLRPHVMAQMALTNTNDQKDFEDEEEIHENENLEDFEDIEQNIKAEDQNSDYAPNSEEFECYVEEINDVPRDRKRKRLSSNSIGHEQRHENPCDAIEHIFIGYAKTIKDLPVKSQIYVKMKVAKIIMEEELKYLAQCN